MPVGTNVYINGTLFFSSMGNLTYIVLSNGIDIEGNTWTYSGSGTFLGFSTTQGATTPDADFEIGDSGASIFGEFYLYSVEQTPAITDLTNTKWVIKENPIVNSNSFNIIFTSNNNNYTSITFLWQDGYHISFDNTEVYWGGFTDWSSQSYRIISITGGTDATNSTLISWLLANATQVPVVDLTDTTWTLTSTTCPSGYGIYSVMCDVGQDFRIGYNKFETAVADVVSCEFNTLSVGDSITFLYGNDIANPDLIVWLTNNATYQAPTPSGVNNVSIGTLAMAKALIGSDEVVSMWLGNVKIYEGEPTPSGYSITVSGVFETSGSSNISSIIKIDGTTCSVNAYGTPTNIPHTFNNIVVQPNLAGAIDITTTGFEGSDRAMRGVIKIISGTGGIYDYRLTLVQAFSANDILEYTYVQDTLYLVPTSDLVIQLGFYED